MNSNSPVAVLETRVLVPPAFDPEIERFIRKLHILNAQGVAGPYKVLREIFTVRETDRQEQLREYFKWNKYDFISLLCMAYDPRWKPQFRRFIPFAAQKHLLINKVALLDRTINPLPEVIAHEKSRDVGWTNTLLLCWLHSAQFWGHSAIVGTKEFKAADNKDEPHSSLLPRIDVAAKMLPDWLLGEYNKTEGKILFGQKASITAQATQGLSAAKFARQGRVAYIHMSEAGFWSSTDLEKCYNGSAQTATHARFIECSAPDIPNHFFCKLVDCQEGIVKDSRGLSGLNLTEEFLKEIGVELRPGIFVKYDVNPIHSPQWLQAQREGMTIEKYEQEIFGKRGGSNAKIINHYFNESFEIPTQLRKKGDSRLEWHYDHDWIQSQLELPGTYFLASDGGSEANTNVSVLGYRVHKTQRVIYLKEFYSAPPKEEIEVILERMERFRKHYFPNKPTTDHGDPALEGERENIKLVTGRTISLLDRMKNPKTLDKKLIEARGRLFQRRKKARIAVMRREMQRKCSDNMPAIIVIKGNMDPLSIKDDFYEFGCPKLYEGLFLGVWQYEKIGSEVNYEKLLQQPPVTDICDAASYERLDMVPETYREPAPQTSRVTTWR